MPRAGRIVVENMPHHIVQRGHCRNAVFIEESDYCYYLERRKPGQIYFSGLFVNELKTKKTVTDLFNDKPNVKTQENREENRDRFIFRVYLSSESCENH